jgi:tagatose-1,6-bisphosphate aldolase
LGGLGVDILKLEFPLSPDDPDEAQWLPACREISAAALTPWIVLSAAVEYQTFLRQVTAACQAGASGIAVGRAVWQEAIHLAGEARTTFLRETGADRLSRLASLCQALGKPVTDFYRAQAPLDWYQSYA